MEQERFLLQHSPSGKVAPPSYEQSQQHPNAPPPQHPPHQGAPQQYAPPPPQQFPPPPQGYNEEALAVELDWPTCVGSYMYMMGQLAMLPTDNYPQLYSTLGPAPINGVYKWVIDGQRHQCVFQTPDGKLMQPIPFDQIIFLGGPVVREAHAYGDLTRIRGLEVWLRDGNSFLVGNTEQNEVEFAKNIFMPIVNYMRRWGWQPFGGLDYPTRQSYTKYAVAQYFAKHPKQRK